MNSFASYVLYFYLLVFVAVLFFDIACVFVRKANSYKLKKLEENFENIIKNINIYEISEDHLSFLSRKLKRNSNFIAFSHVLEKMDEKDRIIYLKKLKTVFLKILSHYEKEDIIKQTYFVYTLSKYPYIYNDNWNHLVHYFIKCCISSSIYLRENALHALYVSGIELYVMEAFRQMNYHNIPHHHKLLTDGLIEFCENVGNTNDLVNALKENLKTYNENFQVACVNFFHYQKIECKEFLYKILINEETAKEVKIACIRYFANIQYKPVLPYLYDFILDDKNNFEYAAVASTTLKNYPTKETLKYLIMALRSHNWYVRVNAANSLIEIVNKKDLETLLKIDDRYAREALIYQMSLKESEG